MSKQGAKKKSTSPGTSLWKFLLVAMVFLVYGSTVKFDFVLDDDLFVRNHPMVQEGVSAIPSAFSQGSMPHFKDVFTLGKADAALAASIFHFKEISIPELKVYLDEEGVVVRN